MPPRERISKEHVLNTAFEMTRESGFEALTARKLAERMDCSTQPIFRAYENMDMLKKDLFSKSAEYFSDYMLSNINEKDPIYISMGMAYIELAKKETFLFKLIADIDDYETDDIHEFLQGEDHGLLEKLPNTQKLDSIQKKELFLMVWMFTHGVATLVTSNRVNLDNEEIITLIKKAYEGFLNQV